MLELIFDFWKDTAFAYESAELGEHANVIDSFIFILSIVSTLIVVILLIGLVKWAVNFVFGMFGRYWL